MKLEFQKVLVLFSDVTKTGNGEWEMENGNGKLKIENKKFKMGN